ncbi:MAG: SDR family oxidoreductase [Dehalococcoidia bacterium]
MPESLLGLEEKVALVTGGGLGIGKGCARMLARAGCNVAVADLSVEHAEQTVKEIEALGRRAVAIEADVRTSQGIEAMLESAVAQLGGLDVCVNNVGGLVGHRPRPFLEYTDEVFDDIVTNNLRATFFCCQAEARSMIARGVAGSIINISSVAGIRATMNIAPYGAAKAGIINLTQVVALEAAPHGIRVNVIAPGTTATERYRHRYEEGAFSDVEATNPMKRLAQPDDLGGAAVYLASDLAQYVTGVLITVDGGISLSTPRPAP